MRQSQLFSKTKKTAPKDEVSKNAQLLLRAGFIHKEMAGVYAFLPLGLRVLEKIKGIVRDEMNAIDGQELIMTSLQPKDVWETTTRWDDEVVDVWFKTELKDGTKVGLAWSHEEPIMEMMQRFVESYKDLPVSVYQFQTKLRNELRAKSGIMRGREFVMKDMYSLHASAEDLDRYYNKVIDAYKRVYNRLGIGKDTYVTFASGGAFTKFSHEFQTLCEAGEDVLYLHREKNIAVNEEVLEEAVKELSVSKEEMEKVRSAEVGNIFNFGTEKAEQMNVTYKGSDGKTYPVYLASYGIGITRAMGVIVEKFADEKGMVWPDEVAPFQVHLLSLGKNEEAEAIYRELTAAGIEVLFDDRDVPAGEKFGDSDLMGMPYRVVVSGKSLAAGGVEVKRRTENDGSVMSAEALLELLA
jgi:prolyl-tRNA synthetase